MPLRSRDWQVHVYGEATPELRAACEQRKLPLHLFPWQPAVRHARLWRNAAYLVRPDGYIGLADAVGSAAALTGYLAKHGIRMV